MRPDASRARRLRVLLSAGLLQLWLEMKVLTGGRAPWLAAPTILWFVLIALMSRFDDEPWSSAVFYNNMMVLPGTILAVALSMGCVMGDRDSKQLETTFVSPTGRHQAWVLRFAAVFLSCWLAVGLLSLLTWTIIDDEHRPVAAWLHSSVPLLFCIGLTVLLSLAFRSGAIAALCSAAYLVLWSFFGDAFPKFNYWFNPFAPPFGQNDPKAFFRDVVFNRAGHLLVMLLLFYGVFALLQRRERLL